MVTGKRKKIVFRVQSQHHKAVYESMDLELNFPNSQHRRFPAQAQEAQVHL
jgi:hypothetical protein